MDYLSYYIIPVNHTDNYSSNIDIYERRKSYAPVRSIGVRSSAHNTQNSRRRLRNERRPVYALLEFTHRSGVRSFIIGERLAQHAYYTHIVIITHTNGVNGVNVYELYGFGRRRCVDIRRYSTLSPYIII